MIILSLINRVLMNDIDDSNQDRECQIMTLEWINICENDDANDFDNINMQLGKLYQPCQITFALLL